jgi:hypothetical protein
MDISVSGAVAAPTSVPESLQVTAPVLSLHPASAHGHALAGRAGDGVSLTLSNTGDAPLHWSASSALAWSAWSNASGTLAAGQSLQDTVRYDAGSLSAGRYTGALSIRSDDSTQVSVQVPDTLDVSAQPDTSNGLSCDSLEVHASVGSDGGAAQTLSLRNRTDGPLTWTVVRRIGWIKLQSYTGVIQAGAASGLSMSFDFTGLPSGDYRDTVVFEWGSDSTRWLRLPVHVAFTAGDASPLICADAPTARWNGASAELDWTPSPDARVVRYHIYRRESAGSFVGLGFVRGDSTRLVDASADTSHSYAYRLDPVDSRGQENSSCTEVRLDARGGVASSVAAVLAYPNPFSAALKVRVDVPGALGAQSSVRVRVMDAGGRVVKTLLDETRPAGRFVLDWDARNGLGQPVVAGLYRVLLDINGQRFGGQWLARRWTP